MIVVLDTNVLVSTLLSPSGPPAAILRHWEAGEFDLVTSQPLVDELRRVLQCPRVQKYLQLTSEDRALFLKRLVTVAAVIEPAEVLNIIDDDPTDNRILECAQTCGADYVVSGDDHLLSLVSYNDIAILTPAEFLAIEGLS